MHSGRNLLTVSFFFLFEKSVSRQNCLKAKNEKQKTKSKKPKAKSKKPKTKNKKNQKQKAKTKKSRNIGARNDRFWLMAVLAGQPSKGSCGINGLRHPA